MRCRRLILTTLGVLAGLPFASQVVENVSAAPSVPALVPKLPIAELFVSVDGGVSEAVAGLTMFGAHLTSTAVSFEHAAPIVTMGELVIRNQFEADAFIRRMAKAIGTATEQA